MIELIVGAAVAGLLLNIAMIFGTASFAVEKIVGRRVF